MFNLILNENMKIYKRSRTWVMAAILVVLVAVVCIIMKQTGFGAGDWRTNLENQKASIEQAMKDMPAGWADSEGMAKEMKLIDYRLANHIPPTETTFWGVVWILSNMVLLVTIFTVVVAGDSIAGEFTGGTVKLLLIRPVSRHKIVISKYISALLFSLLMLVILLISAIAVSALLFGTEGATAPYLFFDGDTIQERSILTHTLLTYGLKCVELLMVVTISFMISAVFRSSSLAIGLSMFILMAGSLVTQFLSQYSWGKYWLFANTDLSQYIEGRPLIEGMTLPFSLAVLAVYYILLAGTSLIVFRKRDVAA
ncbi:ABC transporter permease [Paenibacillus thermotolerans]|uniref:ABC transporter permease n=1 Tax=Paenibacillus thermotolerans TaxID=3027807 RepID=UPI0023687C9F|nr:MULTISPECIES: ABC transporter permease [unclassified Paenibacillus]